MTKFRIAISNLVHWLHAKHLNRFVRKDDFTIVSNDCNAGYIYHQLGRKFLTPTINLYFDYEDYSSFIKDFKRNMNYELVEDKNNDKDFPVGLIVTPEKTYKINFFHYKTYEDASKKWNDRKKRIIWDKIYYIFNLTNWDDKSHIENLAKEFNNLSLSDKAKARANESICLIALRLILKALKPKAAK